MTRPWLFFENAISYSRWRNLSLKVYRKRTFLKDMLWINGDLSGQGCRFYLTLFWRTVLVIKARLSKWRFCHFQSKSKTLCSVMVCPFRTHKYTAYTHQIQKVLSVSSTQISIYYRCIVIIVIAVVVAIIKDIYVVPVIVTSINSPVSSS